MYNYGQPQQFNPNYQPQPQQPRQSQYNPLIDLEAKVARLEALQAQVNGYNQAPQYNNQPQYQEPTQAPQTGAPQVFSVENEQQARDYPIDEGGLVILLMQDGSKVFAKRHNKSNWTTEFSTYNKQEDYFQASAEIDATPRNDVVEKLQTEIEEIKKLLIGVVENVQSIREVNAIHGDAERNTKGNTKGRGVRKSDSGGDAQGTE